MADCQCNQRGCIHLIIGPMFSGKTTELIRLAQRHTLAGRKVVVVKYAHDVRYDATHACTHDKRKMDALSATTVGEVFAELDKFDVVGIDEGQFFKDLVSSAQKLADAGKTVIVAALNGNYRQEPFENVATLIPLAEKIEKLSAVCRCGQSASFTFRMSECTKLELIGGEELYRALCRACVNSFRRIKDQIIEIKKDMEGGGGGKATVAAAAAARKGLGMKRAASGPVGSPATKQHCDNGGLATTTAAAAATSECSA